jgi:ligand-binding sensor domain-containing protein
MSSADGLQGLVPSHSTRSATVAALRATLALLVALFVLAVAARHATPAPVHWDVSSQGGFVTAVCQAKDGTVWVATEDHGVFESDLASPTGWRHFTSQSTSGGYTLLLGQPRRLLVELAVREDVTA